MTTARPLRIGIDARSIQADRCGVSRVAARLVEALSAADAHNDYRIYTEDFSSWPGLGPNVQIVKTGLNRLNPLMDAHFGRILSADGLDVFHSMHAWLPLRLPSACRAVVTIHDAFAVSDPDFFIRRGFLRSAYRGWFDFSLRYSIKKAAAIVTVSQYSAGEITRLYPGANGKVVVIPNGAGIGPEVGDVPSPVGAPYLLYVGNCRSYKAPEVLIEGFAAYKKECPASPLRLIVAGNDPCPDIRAMAERLGVSRSIEFIRAPSDEALAALYRGCRSYVTTSRFEGFGIPLLEAMTFGKPAITSDADALVEVAGDAALTFRRGDALGLAGRIRELETRPGLADELARRGTLRAREFGWDRSARALAALYEKISGRASAPSPA